MDMLEEEKRHMYTKMCYIWHYLVSEKEDRRCKVFDAGDPDNCHTELILLTNERINTKNICTNIDAFICKIL
jgi:hypothetical protein